MTFHGTSNEDELKQAWHNLTNRPEDEIIVNWLFDDKHLPTSDFNIININSNKNTIGHFCLIVKLNDDYVIYYNPIQEQIKQTLGLIENDLPIDESVKILMNYYNVLVDLTGEQHSKGKYSSSCGYYCLKRLRDYLNCNPITNYVVL